jgi:hypothetical protein
MGLDVSMDNLMSMREFDRRTDFDKETKSAA